MKRPLGPEEIKLWAVVAATVRPHPGKTIPSLAEEAPVAGSAPPAERARKTASPATAPAAPLRRIAALANPDPIEPRRKRRLVRERDPIEARLDLHGMDQDRARATLRRFLLRAYEDRIRAVLVITGKGVSGDGVLRRRAPDWLAEPDIRPMIAGVSPAERRHGGEGALYVALKRRTR